MSVFIFKEEDVWHSYSTSPIMSENEIHSLDLLSPFLISPNLTPERRGHFMVKISYSYKKRDASCGVPINFTAFDETRS